MPLELGESEDRGLVDRFGSDSHTVFDAVVINDFDDAICIGHVDLEMGELRYKRGGIKSLLLLSLCSKPSERRSNSAK